MKTIKLQDQFRSFANYDKKSMKILFHNLSVDDNIFTVIGYPYFEIGEHVIKDITEKDNCIVIMTTDGLEMLISAKYSVCTNPSIISKNASEVKHNFIVTVSTNFFKAYHKLEDIYKEYNEKLI